MPYYRWKGVTLQGTLQHGKQFAPTVQQLDRMLFARDIALLHAKSVAVRGWYPITRKMKIDFFHQMHQLLTAGIPVAESLSIAAQLLTYNPRFQIVIHMLATQVQEGTTLHESLAAHAHIFSPLLVQTVFAGHESGLLATTFQDITRYLQTTEQFVNQMRSALYLPLFTFFSLCAVMMFVLFIIIPKFAHFFVTLHQEIPYSLQWLLYISDSITVLSAVGAGVLFVGFIQAVRMIVRTDWGAWRYQWLIMHTPMIRHMVRFHAISHITRTLSLLLRSGMHLVSALEAVSHVIDNKYWQRSLQEIQHAVASGRSFSQALLVRDDRLWTADVVAMLSIGQESGALDRALAMTSVIYEEKLQRILQSCTKLIQPLLLIILGLCVAFLIVSIYAPITHISTAL